MHTCPRRMQEWGPWERTEGIDRYGPDHGVTGQPSGCTFCGSMPPDEFMTAVKAGAEVGPTDKSYKLYVSWPNPEPSVLHPISAVPTGRDPLPSPTLTYLTWAEMSEAQRNEALAVFGADAPGHYSAIGFGTRPSVEAKFYTAHLSPEQGREFYDLWQQGQVRWGYPGHPHMPLYLPGFERPAQ
jgi:hypothetical protein